MTVTPQHTTESSVAEFITDYAQQIQDGSRKYNDFILSLYARIVKDKPLSPAQLGAAEKFMAKQAEFDAKRAEQANLDALAEDVPVGSKVEISGELVSLKYKHGKFGTKLGMLVRDERGFRVWGNVPSTLELALPTDEYGSVDLEAAKGRKVSLEGEVTASDDDPKFGFIKRAKVIAA